MAQSNPPLPCNLFLDMNYGKRREWYMGNFFSINKGKFIFRINLPNNGSFYLLNYRKSPTLIRVSIKKLIIKKEFFLNYRDVNTKVFWIC